MRTYCCRGAHHHRHRQQDDDDLFVLLPLLLFNVLLSGTIADSQCSSVIRVRRGFGSSPNTRNCRAYSSNFSLFCLGVGLSAVTCVCAAVFHTTCLLCSILGVAALGMGSSHYWRKWRAIKLPTCANQENGSPPDTDGQPLPPWHPPYTLLTE